MKNKTLLYVAIALPILLMIVVVGMIYIPSALLKPQYSFIYSNMSSRNDYYTRPVGFYDYGYYYTVDKEGKFQYRSVTCEDAIKRDTTLSVIEKTERLKDCEFAKNIPDPKFYIYNTQTGENKQLTVDEIKKYTLDSNTISPDNIQVVRSYGNNGIFELFGNRGDQNAFYLKSPSASKKIILRVDSTQYGYGDWGFVGWIIK